VLLLLLLSLPPLLLLLLLARAAAFKAPTEKTSQGRVAPLNHLQCCFLLGLVFCGPGFNLDSPALRTLVGRSGQERRSHSSDLPVYWIKWHFIYRWRFSSLACR
jgi:hypothetical protein